MDDYFVDQKKGLAHKNSIGQKKAHVALWFKLAYNECLELSIGQVKNSNPL